MKMVGTTTDDISLIACVTSFSNLGILGISNRSPGMIVFTKPIPQSTVPVGIASATSAPVLRALPFSSSCSGSTSLEVLSTG